MDTMRRFFPLLLPFLLLGFWGDPTYAQTEADALAGPPYITLTAPRPNRRATVNADPVPIIGTVIYDPEVMLYWKVEINPRNRVATIGSNINERLLVTRDEWLTLENVRQETVEDGVLAVLPPWPGLSDGGWNVRIVAVAHDGSFLEQVDFSFNMVEPERPAAVIDLTRPAPGGIVFGSSEIIGTIILDQRATSYEIEILGGPYTTWTLISGPFENPLGEPTEIVNGQIGELPPLRGLPFGEYQLRIIIKGPDSNYQQPPVIVPFFHQATFEGNIALIEITRPALPRGARITVRSTTTLFGNIDLPEGSYWKVEIQDIVPTNNRGIPRDSYEPVFPFWTTIGDIRTDERLGQSLITIDPMAYPPGDYLMRVVIVAPDDTFSQEYRFRMTIRRPNADN